MRRNFGAPGYGGPCRTEVDARLPPFRLLRLLGPLLLPRSSPRLASPPVCPPRPLAPLFLYVVCHRPLPERVLRSAFCLLRRLCPRGASCRAPSSPPPVVARRWSGPRSGAPSACRLSRAGRLPVSPACVGVAVLLFRSALLPRPLAWLARRIRVWIRLRGLEMVGKEDIKYKFSAKIEKIRF